MTEAQRGSTPAGLLPSFSLSFSLPIKPRTMSSPGEPPTLLSQKIHLRRVHPAREELAEEKLAVLRTTAEPQRGLAAGQILALYDGDRLLGGGVYQ